MDAYDRYIELQLNEQVILFPKICLHINLKRLLGLAPDDDPWKTATNINLCVLKQFGVTIKETIAYIQYKYHQACCLQTVQQFLIKTGGPKDEWEDVSSRINIIKATALRKKLSFECQQINRCSIESYDVIQFYQPNWIYCTTPGVPEVPQGYIVVRADRTFIMAKPWATPEDVLALKHRIRHWLQSNHGCQPQDLNGLIIPVYGKL